MNIFLAIPHNGLLRPGVITACSRASRNHQVATCDQAFGCLTHNFNCLWCDALNLRKEMGFTHFAMCHDDIRPYPFWLDTLADEMERLDADVVSSVIAIKDNRGVSSTGIGEYEKRKVCRLTMTEVYKLPETFQASDIDPHGYLAINTGLWICDIRKPWVDDFPGFKVQNWIERNPEGGKQARFWPEDWQFGEWLGQRDLRVFATRKVLATHIGGCEFGNSEPWGSWSTDEEFA